MCELGQILIDDLINPQLSHVYKYDVVLLIYSVTDPSTFKYIKSLILMTANINQKPVILVGNKIDLVRARVISTSGEWS